MKNNNPLQKLTNREHPRRGAMVVLLAAMMSLFIIGVVFTVDVAYMQLVRTEVRIAADASAKAGVENLLRTEDGNSAQLAATRILGLNKVAGISRTYNNGDIVLGKVKENGANGWQFHANQTPYNAMEVTLRLDDNANSSVPLFFARYFGQNNYTPTHKSVAANLVHEIVLCIDRSHSMCFDLSGDDWDYPPGIPNYPAGYITPPHATGSRWAKLDVAIQAIETKNQARSIEPDVGLITWGSDLTLGWGWWPYSGRKFNAVSIDLSLGKNIDQVNSKIADRYGDIMMGGTNMYAGIDAAIDMLTASSTNSLAQKTIILMSDGAWNTGSDPLIAAQEAANENITIHTVSFLSVANQGVMQSIATLTGGKSYSATDAAQLQAAFEELANELPIVLID
ncbi:MAG: VWA domain-containing protein [Planctomycetaceae bacterium]|nr:VWA domain-containing protein [Planctomycetaceae bacterium]